MADENQTDAEKAEAAKIKELESSLAKELDHQINLSTATDSRIEGQVDVNPSIATGAPPAAAVDPKTYESIPKERAPETPPVASSPSAASSTSTSAPEKPPAEVQEISLEDLDALLSQEAPDLKAEIESLQKAGEDPNINAADFSSTDVDGGGAEAHHDLSEGVPKKVPFRARMIAGLKNLGNRFLDFLYQAPIKGFKYLVKFIKEDARNFIAGLFQVLRHRMGLISGFFSGLNRMQWLALVTMILTAGALGYVLLGPHLKIHLGFKFHPGFAHAEVDEEYQFDPAKKFVPISEEGEYPQFVVLLDKVIVNIQPSENSSSNPMIAMRLYFESNSRQGTVEIKDREKEVRDLAQRVLESYTYDQIVTGKGKLEFKEQLRRETTAIMNTGIVKNIYIDDILIKP